MKVYGICKNCEGEISITTDAHTRVEFVMYKDETINIHCKSCGQHNDFHVDRLYAKPSKIAQIISGLVFLIGTPLTFYLVNPVFTGSRNHYVIYIVGGFVLVPVVVFAIINRQDQTRVSSFNNRKLKGRVHNIR